MKKTLLIVALLSGMSAYGAAASSSIEKILIDDDLKTQRQIVELHYKEMQAQKQSVRGPWLSREEEQLLNQLEAKGPNRMNALQRLGQAYRENKMSPEQKNEYSKLMRISNFVYHPYKD